MNIREFSKELYNRFGTVTRARGCFLYTKKGIRVTDMFQENGRAILGWDAGNAFTYIKNFLCRGLTGSFVCQDKSALAKAISYLLSETDTAKNCLTDRTLFYFSSKSAALKAALKFSPESTNMYKPWSPEKTDWNNIECVIISPALPWTETIYILAVKSEIIPQNNKLFFPDEIQLPYAVETGITRSVYNLIEALNTRQEKEFFIYDTILTKYWERKGPYLFPKIPQEKYDDFVLHCLDNEIAINPDYNSPSIIPYKADKGVFTKLRNNPFNF